MRRCAKCLFTLDGYVIFVTNIAVQFGRRSENTVAKARRQLVDARWLVIRRYVNAKGNRVYDEWWLHRSRKFTKAEVAELAGPVALGTPQILSTPDLTNCAPPASTSEAPPPQKLRPKEDQEEYQEEYQVRTSSSDIKEQKQQLRPEVRQLVDSLIPAHYNRNHLTNIAVKAMVENSVPLRCVEKALEEWNDGYTEPGALMGLIMSEMEYDPVALIKRMLAGLESDDDGIDITSLRRLGYWFPMPDLPLEIRTVDEAREYVDRHKIEWLQGLLNELEQPNAETVPA